jgi:aminoglycoside 6'-N-acetyltransferase
MLRRWLRAPEVARWWGDPDAESALLEGDLDEPLMAMLIVAHGGRPFAYAQHYDVHSWPQPHLADLPPGARAVDSFIGEADMIGRGHGSAYLRRLAQRLIAAGAPVVAIDPVADNQRARRAYWKAGFRGKESVETAAGPVVPMIYAG